MIETSFTKLTDLAAEKLGGQTLSCSDDFFAGKENLIKYGRGIFIADKYTDRGKWMDGWESRRKRIPGNDWCVIQLAAPGKIRGVDIDTNHFLGNHPPYASIDACYCTNTIFDPVDADWNKILEKSALEPGSQNLYPVTDQTIYSHIRLNIYPDGGVARLKVYGEVFKDWNLLDEDIIDLASALNGAKSVLCNDMFFSHMDNLIMPGRGINMGDGWETKRNRAPSNSDWVIIRLAHKGTIEKILVDTCHFKGNYPESCMIEGALVSENDDENILIGSATAWTVILHKTKLKADHEHIFEEEVIKGIYVTHIRLSIFPDGGISRIRLWGKIIK